MESASTNLPSILEEEEEEGGGGGGGEVIGPSTLGSDKMPWKQDSRSIQEMEDKENIPEYPVHISDFSVSEKKSSPSIEIKKRKGFNLRKSLAWNPAFFTEEGVLDSAELSYICGSIDESSSSTTSSNRLIINDAVKSSQSKSQVRTNLQRHTGRKMFITPEPPKRQEKRPPEGARKLKQSGPVSRTLLRPPTTIQQKRAANTSIISSVTKVQKFVQGSTTPSRGSNNQEHVSRAGENSNGPRPIHSIQEKEPVFMPKSSTGDESSPASQMNSQIIPKASMNAPLTIKPSALRKPSPSYGFFAQGNVAAQSSSSSQKSTEKTFTCIPSTLPKPPPSKWRPPVGYDAAKKLTAGTFPQSKIPQRMRFDRLSAYTTGKKNTEKTTKTSVKPRENSVACQLACNKFSCETCSTNDLDTAVCKSNDASFAEKPTAIPEEVKEPAVTRLTCNLVSSKACNPMDVHATLAKPGNAVSTGDGSMKNQYKNSRNPFVEAEEPHAAQLTSNSILYEACSSIDVKSVVGMPDDAGSNVNTNGLKHIEEENISCGKEETAANLLTQNSISLESCFLMDMDIISKSHDLDSRVITNCMKQTQYSNLVSEEQEETAVTPLTCNHIPPETCSSKNKRITSSNQSVNSPARGDIGKISVSAVRTQRGNTDFSPCKEKPLEKRFKLDSGSPLAITEKEFLEDDKPEAGKVEEKIAEPSEGRMIPKFRMDLVPFSEEWLAALEAYGEEILVKKTGPVQNSPPDKTIPEPSPWSPVQRKTQDIGPYDCTKYSKTIPSSDAQ